VVAVVTGVLAQMVIRIAPNLEATIQGRTHVSGWDVGVMRSARDDGLSNWALCSGLAHGYDRASSVAPQQGALFHMTVDDAFWDDLLMAIEEGHVVPFVGRDLLTVETPTGPEPLHHLVARRLANQLGVDTADLPGGFDPNDVVVFPSSSPSPRATCSSRCTT
jgi:hypothetical protein